ncbi:hypothetical protein [uncultured Sphaerochaeta sp.]|uniref:hypothetical protein n=1 Tax=uncultured Sphaerochaeta sp. TaxID=886478 RepID=UPI0029C9F0EC|nr:hypothetical protein [uncultured Sphaerochaeta sp.]MDC7230459.1 hypothetical protein [Sphaerochaetaceae bacterium]
MQDYYLNLSEQDNGDHEVHTRNCYYFDQIKNYEYLGSFQSCHSAVRIAKVRHPNFSIDGCKYCCPSCHNH